jgi:hypothetical protein
MAADQSMMAVPVEAHGNVWAAGVPQKLFDRHYFTSGVLFAPQYDVSADGQRFIMIKETSTEDAGSALPIIVVQHFDEELKRLVPTK